MAIPKYKLDEILMNAFLKVFKIGGLYKARRSVWDDSDWRPEQILQENRFYILLKTNLDYNYEAYCKMCWNGKDDCVPLHYHVTLLDANKYKEVFVSLCCRLPKTTTEISMFHKLCVRLKNSDTLDSIEDKDNNGI